MNQEERNMMSELGSDTAGIEEEIALTRLRVDQTLTALQHRLSREMIADQTRSYLADQAQGGREFLANLLESVKRNPVPSALLGIGVLWLMISGRSQEAPRMPSARPTDASPNNVYPPGWGRSADRRK